jgi:tRNA G18 (ribose-2'-O)-methylase SpoU
MVDYREIINQNNQNSFNVRDDLKSLSVEEIRENQPKHNFSICCGNITGDMNLSNIIRSAVIFGADKVYIIGRKKFDRRGMVGANNYIDIEFVGGLVDELTLDWKAGLIKIQNDGYDPVFVETGGKSMDSSILGKKPCFIFGNEGMGIPSEIIDEYSHLDLVTIPMYGVMRSLNVASCAAIVMADYNKFYWGD